MTKEELEKYTVDFMNNETRSNGSKPNSVLGKMLIKYAEIFQKRIADLEKENAELKDGIALKDEEVGCVETDFNTFKSKAKDLIGLLLSDNRIMKAQFESEEQANIWFEHIRQAEQFLKENE